MQQKQIILNLSKKDFDIADACARELWRGYNYSDDYLTISDEIFMAWFGIPFIELQQIKASSLFIHAENVDKFITIINMRNNKINKTLDLNKGLDELKTICERDYASWKKTQNKRKGGLQLATTSIKSVGYALFKPKGRLKQGKFFVLASRILFFAAPDLPVFNISERVSTSFGIKSVITEKNLVKFNYHMNANLQHYWNLLINYRMPLPANRLDDEYWLVAKNGGWWQRRILDLAIMHKAGEIEVKQFIEQAADQSFSPPI